MIAIMFSCYSSPHEQEQQQRRKDERMSRSCHFFPWRVRAAFSSVNVSHPSRTEVRHCHKTSCRDATLSAITWEPQLLKHFWLDRILLHRCWRLALLSCCNQRALLNTVWGRVQIKLEVQLSPRMESCRKSGLLTPPSTPHPPSPQPPRRPPTSTNCFWSTTKFLEVNASPALQDLKLDWRQFIHLVFLLFAVEGLEKIQQLFPKLWHLFNFWIWCVTTRLRDGKMMEKWDEWHCSKI